MIEIWKDIPDYIGLYQASNLGRIKSLKRTVQHHGYDRRIPEKIRVCTINNCGYSGLLLYKEGIRTLVRVHRIVLSAFYGKSDLMVDHIDGNKLNNKLSNLRYCTGRENRSFTNVKITKTSKYTGVSWYKQSKKWKAQIQLNGKVKSIGYFLKEEDASKAYQKALSQILQ